MLLPQFIRVLQMLALLAMQVLFFNHICLFGYATPMVSVAFLLYFPFNASRVGLLLWAFAMGFFTDVFSNTPGICSASMTFAAMLRPLFLRFLVTKDVVEDMIPTYSSMGTWTHIRFIICLTILHHLAYFALESFSVAHSVDAFFSFLSSLLLTLLVIFVLERFRSNTK